MRERIDVLLAAYAAGKDRLDPPARDDTRTASGLAPTADYQPGPEPGTVIAGRYKLLEKIGEGGMGEVWVAKQTEPVTRKVAVKLIKPGMDSQRVIARFEAERQALALMDHPNIAKVLDGGIVQAHGRTSVGFGRPYFVMELVNGRPLTQFCDEAKLTPRDRLNLFVPVCQAVQHAHQKGIIHRDLKPSNILVTLYDGKPVPKVIDFGVAKATGGKLTDESVSTQFGAVVGTFEYMAPEQAGLSALDVDTRADVYALGVILYELLTGLRPFDGPRLRKAAIDEMFRILREEEPPKPSTKLSSDAALPSLAAVRGTEPKKLTALMKGELDWIVMKCLEKDRARRYETANGLARDVERYLADEPVEAGPPGTGYRVRKFLRRHRTACILAIAFTVLVLVGTGVSTWQAVRATQAEGEAGRRLVEANAERDRAAAEERRANREAAVAEAVSTFLRNVLAQASPNAEPDRDLRLRSVLDRAAERIEGQFGDQPLVEAAVRMTIAATYRALGLPAVAQPHVERAADLYARELGPDHRQTLRAMNGLAVVYQDQEKYDQAMTLKEHVFRVRLARFGERDADTLLAMNNLADLHRIRGRYELAKAMFQKVVGYSRDASGPTHVDTLRATLNLAECSFDLCQYSRAEELLKEVIATFASNSTETDPVALTATHNLGCVYRERGRYDRAEAEFAKALAGRETRLGRKAPDVAATLVEMGLNDVRRKEYAPAEDRLRRGVAILKETSPDSWQLFNAYGRLGACLLGRGQYVEAERLLKDGYQGMVKRRGSIPMGEADCLTDALGWLVELYTARGKPAEAAEWRAERAKYPAPIEAGPRPRVVP